MTILLLIRHGENDLVARRMAGRLPGVDLNELGRLQAAELADRLAPAPISVIYSSPLERALQTAAPLAARLELPVLTLPWLVEVDFGTWQGKTYRQLRRQKLWRTVQERPAAVRFPGGESLREAQQRAVAGIDALAAGHPAAALVACFTHGDIIRLAVAHYLNMSLDDFQRLAISTASLTALAFFDGAVRLLCYNQVSAPEWPKPPAVEKK